MFLKTWLTRKPNKQMLWRIPLIAYLTLAAYAYFFSDRQIFIPQYAANKPLPHPPINLTTRDQEIITAIHLTHPQAKYTILYSHGNGETIGDAYPDLLAFQKLGFNLFAYDYRGYGLSQGKPSVPKAYQDIEAAYDYLIHTLKIPADRIIIYGRSVGSGPSVYLASRQPSAGLILESAFTSTFRVILPFKILPFDKFPNQERLPQVKVPILIIHGTQDQVIPFSHGQTLYQTANAPKTFLPIDGADHNDVNIIGGDRYYNSIRQFADRLPAPP
jgi:abhydrolase domain-containing protein 17